MGKRVRMSPAAATQKAKMKVLPDTYFDLVRAFPLTSIRDVAHHAEAERVLHELLKQDLDEGGSAYLGALTELIGGWEDENEPFEDIEASEVLKELLHANRLTQADLAKQTGIAPSTISALCLGTRKPTVEHAKKLGERFGLKAAAFLPL